VLMKALYGARMARFDFLKGITTLAQRVTKWTTDDDAALYRLMCYIYSTLNVMMVGYVGVHDKAKDWQLDLYGDADFAGCLQSSRSTTGSFLCAVSKHTRFPLGALSKKHGCVSHSTPEAEIVAFAHAIRAEGLPALVLFDKILQRKVRLNFHEDNTATIRIIEVGRSNALRHLNRTHRVDFRWYHERLKEGAFTLQYVESKKQAADIFTKLSHNRDTWKDLMSLIGHHGIGAVNNKSMLKTAADEQGGYSQGAPIRFPSKKKKSKRKRHKPKPEDKVIQASREAARP
jgi:hypothetical protein